MRRSWFAVVGLVALAGCTPGGASRAEVEQAVTTTFGNRLAAVEPAADPGSTGASCAGAGGRDRGAGDWSCSVRWAGADGLAHAAEYDVQVSADGCFRAAQQGAAPASVAAPVPALEGCTAWG